LPLGPITQRNFLLGLGLDARVNTLLRAATSEARQEQIASAAKRLVDPLGMGTQYKVLGVIGTKSADSETRVSSDGYHPFGTL
jgi:NADH dehydrogenase [ubiquinone] 1 alpha subcomplex assembly factor 7